MSVTWPRVRPQYACIVEWWHGPKTTSFRQSLRFAEAAWCTITTGADPLCVGQTPEDTDVKLWILTLALLWRAYLVDWGATHPIEADDWPAITEWIQFDVWEHFGLDDTRPDDDEWIIQEALRWDFEVRALQLTTNMSNARLAMSMNAYHSSMTRFTSFENMRYVLGELRAKEQQRVLSLRPHIVAASDLITRRLALRPQDIRTIKPREFEEVVAELMADSGYTVQLTPTTRDGGCDILATHKEQGEQVLLLIETKRYRSDRPVGVGAVRSLLGALVDRGAGRGMLVTTSRFTRDARHFFLRHPYQLQPKTYRDVVAWIQRYGRPKRAET